MNLFNLGIYVRWMLKQKKKKLESLEIFFTDTSSMMRLVFYFRALHMYVYILTVNISRSGFHFTSKSNIFLNVN